MLDPHRTHVTATGVLSSAHVGHVWCSPARYPWFGQIENVGVTVMYGRWKLDSARLTSSRHAAAVESFSDMYRCSTVPPVYFFWNSSCSSSASKGASV